MWSTMIPQGHGLSRVKAMVNSEIASASSVGRWNGRK